MSRTVRRKSVSRNHWKYRWVTHEYVVRRDGHWVCEWVPLEGTELKRNLNRFHSDNGYTTISGCGRGPGVWFRRREQQKHRTKAKAELNHYKRDSDYEVQIQARPYLPYWD